jgi:transcriptional regulator with XRE-family HTH domain
VLREDVGVNDDAWQARLEALCALLREERMAAGLTLRELSERTNVSNAYLSQLERGRHEPSLRVLMAIAAALDVPLGSLLTRAGIVDHRTDAGEPRVPQTEAAILGDPGLAAEQRFALLSVYRSFTLARRPV